MRRLAADDASQTDNRLVAAALGRVLCRQGDFEGAGHPHDSHLAFGDTSRGQGCERSGLQTIGDHVVVLRHDDGEAKPLSHVQNRASQQPHRGNGYISQPSTKADARKPANIRPPNRLCSRVSSLARTAKTSETKKAKVASSRK